MVQTGFLRGSSLLVHAWMVEPDSKSFFHLSKSKRSIDLAGQTKRSVIFERRKHQPNSFERQIDPIF